jgi:hypothetical protein
MRINLLLIEPEMGVKNLPNYNAGAAMEENS